METISTPLHLKRKNVESDQSVIPETPKDELEEILAKAEIEAGWWVNYEPINDLDDLAERLHSGHAEIIDDEGQGYKLSANIPREFRILDVETKALMQKVCAEYKQRVIDRLPQEKHGMFLVVSSLARTTKYQAELRAKGYPAAENSTHTQLAAFDIAIGAFEKYGELEAFAILKEIMNELSASGMISVIYEPSVGAYHIGRHPDYSLRL